MIVLFENEDAPAIPARCPKCGTNGAHYCPADLCGPDEEEPATCEYCDKPVDEDGPRLCEPCADDLERAAAREKREADFEDACDRRRQQMKEEP